VTVIGVLQPAPFFPTRVDVLGNRVNSEHHLGASMLQERSHRMTEVVARLAPGASLERARNEVATGSGRIQGEFKQDYDAGAHHRFAVIPFHEVLGERARLTLWLLMAAAAFVMIISAANVANLTLMRGVRRQHELVVRAALGAGVGRLRRLLLVENLVLAFVGAIFGVVIANGGVKLLTSLAERYSPRASEIRLDGVVLAFTVALSVAVALLMSVIASLPREGSLGSRILAGAQRISGSLSRQRLQRGLVVIQIAVSVVLLAGAGLLTRTMMRLAEVDTGLTTEEVLTMQVNNLLTRAERRSNPAAVAAAAARMNQMRDEIAALPGVVEVGVGSAPLRNTDLVREIKAEGKPLAVGEAMPRAELRAADQDYFRAAGIPLLAGRAFSTTDPDGSFAKTDPTGSGAVIINRRVADRLFPGEDPLGKRIAWTNGTEPVFGDWYTIVGIVGNTQDGGLDAQPRGVLFLHQAAELGGGLVIRTGRNVSTLAAEATRIVRRIAPMALIEDVMTVAQIKDESVSPRRLNAALISSFGLLAVIIAAVGIGGVLAFSVSARTNEIGIRMSLGADSVRVQRMILGEGTVLLARGLTLGVGGAYVAGGVIRGLLFGVVPHDPVTFVAVTAMMAAIGIVACWIPALRASRIDPAITMRA
jgi:putative ABC transport system permease protein